MRILITGNAGYSGPCVIRQLRQTWPGARLIGVDTGYFEDCAPNAESAAVDHRIDADIRDLPAGIFNHVNAVVHLAALSDDSTAKTFESAVGEINCRAALDIAKKAKKAGVKSFVFASSCKVYRASEEDIPRTENCELNPLTAYARSKVAAEQGLKGLAGREFTVSSLRFATACGMSPRLRPDTILNHYVASAISSGQIRVTSSGAAWLRLIHVRDMARANDWAVARPGANGGAFLAMNTGSDAWTLRVNDLANAVAGAVPGATVSFLRDAPPETGSWRVDFSLFRRLAPLHQPREKVASAIAGMKTALEAHFARHGTDTSRMHRVKVLSGLLQQGRLRADLRWASVLQPEPESFALAGAGR
jgi:nucleoside-diphosphate-sugar epimerase